MVPMLESPLASLSLDLHSGYLATLFLQRHHSIYDWAFLVYLLYICSHGLRERIIFMYDFINGHPSIHSFIHFIQLLKSLVLSGHNAIRLLPKNQIPAIEMNE